LFLIVALFPNLQSPDPASFEVTFATHPDVAPPHDLRGLSTEVERAMRALAKVAGHVNGGAAGRRSGGSGGESSSGGGHRHGTGGTRRSGAKGARGGNYDDILSETAAELQALGEETGDEDGFAERWGRFATNDFAHGRSGGSGGSGFYGGGGYASTVLPVRPAVSQPSVRVFRRQLSRYEGDRSDARARLAEHSQWLRAFQDRVEATARATHVSRPRW
jgi:hypothetical protein